MPFIIITGIILAPADDQANYYAVNAGVRVSPFGGAQGEVRLTVSGRTRRIGKPGKIEGVNVFIPLVDRDGREWLKTYEGELMLYRDGRGRLIFGTYEEANGDDLSGPDLANIGLSLVGITHSIEV